MKLQTPVQTTCNSLSLGFIQPPDCYPGALPTHDRPKGKVLILQERMPVRGKSFPSRGIHIPQLRKPYSVWWQCEHVAPQSRLWRPECEETGLQSRPE